MHSDLLLNGQNKSTSVALAELQVNFDQTVARLRFEKQELESEKQSLVNKCSTLTSKLDQLKARHAEESKNLSDQLAATQTRLNDLFNSSNTREQSLNELLHATRDEADQYQRDLLASQRAFNECNAQLHSMEATFKARDSRLNELEQYVVDKERDLVELEELRRTVSTGKYRSSNQSSYNTCDLGQSTNQDQPSDLPITPADFSSSSCAITRLAKLQLDYDRLSSTCRALASERTNWLVEREELSDLKHQVAALKEWRRRALEAENDLFMAKQSSSSRRDSLSGGENNSVGRVLVLERENQLLLGEQTELKARLGQLECQLANRAPSSIKRSADQPVDSHVVMELQHQVSCLKRQVSQLQTENETLTTKVSQHQNQPESCDYISPSGQTPIQLDSDAPQEEGEARILTLTNNPVSQAKSRMSDEIVTLRHDNERQRQRIQVLETCIGRLKRPSTSQQQSADVDSSSNSSHELSEASSIQSLLSGDGSVTRLVDQRIDQMPDPLTELEHVRNQLRVERMRGDRMMETFQQASSRLRSACRDLLGYRIDVRTTGECRLHPVLPKAGGRHQTDGSESSPPPTLSFRCIKGGKLQLVETPFTRSLDAGLRCHLDASNQSIPCFSAALLLQLHGVEVLAPSLDSHCLLTEDTMQL